MLVCICVCMRVCVCSWCFGHARLPFRNPLPVCWTVFGQDFLQPFATPMKRRKSEHGSRDQWAWYDSLHAPFACGISCEDNLDTLTLCISFNIFVNCFWVPQYSWHVSLFFQHVAVPSVMDIQDIQLSQFCFFIPRSWHYFKALCHPCMGSSKSREHLQW